MTRFHPAYAWFWRWLLAALPCLAFAAPAGEVGSALWLTGRAEVPQVDTAAYGSGEIIVLPDRTVSGSIRVRGLAPTEAHIHEAPAGANGPPIIEFQRTSPDEFELPKDARLTEAQYLSYKNDGLYVNVHSADYPDGEIRAQLRYIATAAR